MGYQKESPVLKQWVALGLLAGVMMLGFSASATASAAAEVLDRIVAVVNEEIILLSELNERMAPYAQRVREQGFDLDREKQMLGQLREEMINRLVDEKLTDQEIARNDIQLDEAAVDRTIERIKAANKFSDEDLRRQLALEQMTMEEYRDSIREQVLRTQLVNYEVKSRIVITDQEIQDYYDNHPELYGGEVYFHLKNILLRVPQFASESEKQALVEQMQAIRAQITAGESFSDLARAHSQGPSAQEGGDIGEFAKETLSPQIRTALEGLAPGQATDVLDTDQGLQLFYLEAINRTEGKPLASVKAEIHQKLFEQVVDQKFLAWLEELRSQSHIKIFVD